MISEGWTKIEAPIMMPATIAVACKRPMGLSKAARLDRRSKMAL